MSSAWVCPVCGRRAPGYATTCHCGTARPADPTPEQLAAAERVLTRAPRPTAPTFKIPFDARKVPWQVWAGLGGGVFVLLVGLLVGLWLGPPDPAVPLLGYADRLPPSAPPELLPDPTPTPTPAHVTAPVAPSVAPSPPAITPPLPTAAPTPLPTPNPDAEA
jgi:hypothetical protein